MGKKGSNNAAPKSDGRHSRAVRIVVLTLVVAAAGVWLMDRAVAGLRRAAGELPGSFVAIEDVDRTPLPPWIEADVPRRALVELETSGRGINLAAADVVPRLASALRASPWVDRARIEKRYGSLRLDLVYRRPELCLPWNGKYFYTNRDGVVLPPDEANVDALRQALVVEGIAVAEPPTVGTRLDDERLRAVGRLAEMLEPVKAALGVTTVAVARAADSDLDCRLETRGGSRVLWPPIGDTDTAERRIEALTDVLSRFGSLDQPDGPYQYTFNVDRTEYLVRTRLKGDRPLRPIR